MHLKLVLHPFNCIATGNKVFRWEGMTIACRQEEGGWVNTTFTSTLQHSLDSVFSSRLVGINFKIITDMIKKWFKKNICIIISALTCFNVKKTHSFSNTVHYCRSSMPRLSQTRHFLQSPSFQQVQSALIGQQAQCIVIGRTPQALVGNVTPLSINANFIFQNKCKDR